jgi:predicted dehydrogenase
MTDDEKVPVAVIGAGNMGSNHIRVYDEMSRAELVEVVEEDRERATKVREEYDVDVLSSVDELSQAVAASVTVPTRLHRDIAESCVSTDIDVLIEKPLANTVQEAKRIVRYAQDNEAVIQVGHIERFNPAVRAVHDILEEQDVISVEAHRLGPFSEQLSEENVVFDLMIHDIDIISMIAGSEATSIEAMGLKKRSDSLDHAVSQFRFDNDIIGVATASHVTHGKVRTLNVVTREAYIEMDYQKQNVRVQRRGSEKTTELLDKSGYVSETITETPYIKNREPLKNELEHFLNCVINRQTPEVDGGEGLKAVATASKVVEDITG